MDNYPTLFANNEAPVFSPVSATEEELFAYYRREGFPNYRREDYIPAYELRKVRAADELAYFNGKVFCKYQSANGYLFSYFPHWIEVECGASLSLRECWDDDRMLRALIKKTKQYCEKYNENWSTNRLRQNAKVYCAGQSVSNFNPVCARILYDKFAPGGVVYDMSMGWGGRLLGFHASRARLYIGCEPSTKTIQGLRSLQKDLQTCTEKDALLIQSGSECVDLKDYNGLIDFAFTSPPYFDTEKYSDEPTQSYIAFPSLDKWVQGFLRPTIERSYKALRPAGVFAMNYSNDKRVTAEIVDISVSLGLTLEGIFKYELSSIAGNGAKYEPIFVFRKGGEGTRHELKNYGLF